MFLHSVAVQEAAIGADGVQVYDLAVNPLSLCLVCLRPLNETSTIGNYARYLAMVGAVARATILHRGEAIVNMTGADIAAMNFFRYGILPMEANSDDADNERRCVVLPILLGKFAYDKSSCFPSSKRGELVLELDLDIADTGYDGLRLSVETVEILDAKPKEYERKVATNQTFAATGNVDVDFPPGNPCRGILVWGTTGFAGASPAPSWGRMSVMLDNRAVMYSSTDFEVAHMLPALWGRQPPRLDAHTHRVDASSASTTEETGGPIEVGSDGWQNYAFLDMDPTRDDAHTLATRSASRFNLRADAETADAVRAIPIEVVK